MFRSGEPSDAAEVGPHLIGAKARVAALNRDATVGATPVADTHAAHDEAAKPPMVGWVPDRKAPHAGSQHPRGGRHPSRHKHPRVTRRQLNRAHERDDESDAEPEPVPWRDAELAQKDDHEPLESVEEDASNRRWAMRLTSAGPWGELAEKWVPEPLRGARVDPGRRGAILLAVVAAIAAVVAAVGVWWTKPEPIPVTSSAGAAISSTGLTEFDGVGTGIGAATGGQLPEPTRPSELPELPASTAQTGPILVSVTGNVRHPGLVTVPADARVADAIAAAGGVSDEEQLTGLNLAAHLTDGASVVVDGASGSTVASEAAGSGADPAGSGNGASGAGAQINLNTADEPALQSLSGIGPVTAEAIIAYRTEHGPFTDLAQLQEVSGIGPATFARLQPHVTL